MVAGALIIGGSMVGGSYLASKGAKDATNAQIDAANQMSEAQRQAALEAGTIKADAIGKSTTEQQVGLDKAHQINYDAITAAADQQITGIQQRSDAMMNAAQDAEREYELALAQGTRDQQAAAKASRDAKVAAAQQAQEAYQQAVATANRGIQSQLDKSTAAYQPYMDTGLDANAQLRAGAKAGGDFNRSFTAADFVKDPGYDFRLQQGMTGVENSAAARGGLLSGNTLKALNEYGQGFASNEYQNAYTRFNNDMNTRFSRLSSLADRGMSATGSVATLGANAANAMGANTMAGGAYGAQSLRDIGGYNADAETKLGDISKSFYNDLGNSRANANLTYGSITGGRISDITNAELQKINSRASNEAGYAKDTANLTSSGTLAIGNAKADALTGANNATAQALASIGNANAANAAAQGQIWGGTLSNLGSLAGLYYGTKKGP